MKCPWLVNTVVETNNRNSFNDARRTEHQEFAKCVSYECPFYDKANNKCLRAESEIK